MLFSFCFLILKSCERNSEIKKTGNFENKKQRENNVTFFVIMSKSKQAGNEKKKNQTPRKSLKFDLFLMKL